MNLLKKRKVKYLSNWWKKGNIQSNGSTALTIYRIKARHFRKVSASVVAWQLTPRANHILRKLRASGTGLVFQYHETIQTKYSKPRKETLTISAWHLIILKLTQRSM